MTWKIRKGAAFAARDTARRFARQANDASDCKSNRVTVVRIGERLPQRAGATVVGVRDRDDVRVNGNDQCANQYETN